MSDSNISSWQQLYNQMPGDGGAWVDKYRSPVKDAVFDAYQEFLEQSTEQLPASFYNIVSIGAGYTNLACQLVRDPQIPKLKAHLIDIGYDTQPLARQCYYNWLNSFNTRLATSKAPTPGTLQQIVDSDGYLQQRGITWVGEIGTQSILTRPNLLSYPVEYEGLSAKDILSIVQYLSTKVGTPIRFDTGDGGFPSPHQPVMLEMVHILNYLDGRSLYNWVGRNVQKIDGVVFANGDSNVPRGIEDFRDINAFPTRQFIDVLRDFGLVPIQTFESDESEEVSGIFVSQRFKNETWYNQSSSVHV